MLSPNMVAIAYLVSELYAFIQTHRRMYSLCGTAKCQFLYVTHICHIPWITGIRKRNESKQTVRIVHRIQLTGAATGKVATLGLGAFFDMRIPVMPKCSPGWRGGEREWVKGCGGGGGVCVHFLPWMQCICRQSSGQAMPRAHCSLTVDAKQAAFPLSTTHTHPLTQLQQQPVILAFAMPWSGAGAGLGLVRLRTC